MAFDSSTLELFVRVSILGAIGKAGREFGLSATAATQRIKGLEQELGVKLFTRTTRVVTLTAEGEVFLNHASRILASFEDARTDLSGGLKNVRGPLRVTSSASFGRRHIAPHIAEFLSCYPEVSVHLELSDGVIDIVEQGFDLALRIGTLESSTLIARKLADNHRQLVASPAYLASAGTLKKPQDLLNHNCLVLAGNRKWQLRDKKNKIHEVRVKGSFTTNYGEVITEAARADAGIALKSVWDIRHLLADGSLVPVLEQYKAEPLWQLWAVRPPGTEVPARVRAFTEFMEKKLRDIT